MSDTTPQDRAVEVGSLALNGGNPKLAIERWGDEVRLVVRALADAGLLSSGRQEEEDQGGSLRSGPPAAVEVQWAVLSFEDDSVYDSEASANRALSFLQEDGDDGFRLYEIREVPHA